MSDYIIPTAEEAADAARRLSFYCKANPEAKTVSRAINTVLPLLEAIAAGRVFEVRPEPCAMCRGRGHSSFQDDGVMVIHDCPRCDGSGYEPAPPGRKQRTAYDAMIEDVTDGKHGDRMRKLISEQLATRPCDDCNGEPTFEFAKCYTCDGTGRLPRVAMIDDAAEGGA